MQQTPTSDDLTVAAVRASRTLSLVSLVCTTALGLMLLMVARRVARPHPSDLMVDSLVLMSGKKDRVHLATSPEAASLLVLDARQAYLYVDVRDFEASDGPRLKVSGRNAAGRRLLYTIRVDRLLHELAKLGVAEGGQGISSPNEQPP